MQRISLSDWKCLFFLQLKLFCKRKGVKVMAPWDWCDKHYTDWPLLTFPWALQRRVWASNNQLKSLLNFSTTDCTLTKYIFVIMYKYKFNRSKNVLAIIKCHSSGIAAWLVRKCREKRGSSYSQSCSIRAYDVTACVNEIITVNGSILHFHIK